MVYCIYNILLGCNWQCTAAGSFPCTSLWPAPGNPGSWSYSHPFCNFVLFIRQFTRWLVTQYCCLPWNWGCMCQTVHDPADESWQEGGREGEGLRTCCGRLLQTKSRGGATSAESGEGFPQSAGGAGGTFTCTAVGRREQRDFQLLVASTSLPLRALDWVTESKFAKQTLRRYL